MQKPQELEIVHLYKVALASKSFDDKNYSISFSLHSSFSSFFFLSSILSNFYECKTGKTRKDIPNSKARDYKKWNKIWWTT